MPGPKMGPRPDDFDEELVRRSPTLRKWEALLPGAKLRYACREFVKGHGEDQERLMRRIMIARRNNVRDHKALKWARRMQSSDTAKVAVSKAAPNSKQSSSSQAQNDSGTTADVGTKLETVGNGDADKEEGINGGSRDNNASSTRIETEAIISRTSHILQQELEPSPGRRTRRLSTHVTDEDIKDEMDVPAVEATRSFKTWLSLPDGAEFLYNQKYIKGHEAHDWLLKKNIWRRMRYRRVNKRMVEDMLSRERGGRPLSIQLQQQSSRKRKHDATISGNNSSVTATISATTSAGRDTDRVTAYAAVAQSVAEVVATNETNRQEVVASTASEIVDHALLSTNTGAVVAGAAQSMVRDANTKDSDNITISIGDLQQQHQNPSSHPLHQHHHDPAESAAAFAASIALAGSVVDVNGIGVGTHGDLASHQVADSAAVEAAVAAALAATDAKSNSYHHHHHAVDLLDVNHVIHGTNDQLEPGTTTGGITVGAGLSSTAGSSTTPTSATAVSAATPAPGDVGLGLALDAAAKLAAAAAESTSSAEEVVLAATTAITTSGPVGEESSKKGGD